MHEWDRDSDRPRVPGLVVERLLGQGVAGPVWAARDTGTGEALSVEVARMRVGADAVGAALLNRQVHVVRGLGHPHVLALHRLVDLPEGRSAFVCEHADGGSLSALLRRRGSLAPAETATVVIPLAEALDVIHHAGLGHGRLTPSTVLFTRDGRPLLAGVGLAALTGRGSDPSSRPEDDLRALAGLGLRCLPAPECAGRGSGQGPLARLREVLIVAAAGSLAAPDGYPGRALARAVYEAVTPEPVRLSDMTAGRPQAPSAAPVASARPSHRQPRRVRSPRWGIRAGGGLIASLVCTALVAGGAAAVLWQRTDSGAADGPVEAAASVSPKPQPSGSAGPEAAVTALARRRDAALAALDETSLAAVDVERSPAMAADRELVLRLRASGARPIGHPTVILDTRLLSWRLGAAVVEVRTATQAHTRSGTAAQTAVTVPATPARVVRLVLHPGGPDGWRVWSVESG